MFAYLNIRKLIDFLSLMKNYFFYFNMTKLLEFLTLMKIIFLFQYEKAARIFNFDKGFILYFNIRMLLDFFTSEEGFNFIYLLNDLKH